MDTKENKTIKFIIISILIITVISLIGFAFARYITRLNGGATADIAKWSFKVNGKTDENFVINLANTRTGITQEAEVQEGYIGPGTAGAFQLELDARGSEASLEYNINMNVDYSNNQVFPKNLIFYSDSEMQNAIYHTDNNINLNGFIGWNDNSKVHTKTIYWKWDYETGSTQTEKDNNDIADSYWIGKPITLSMNVTAKQVNENTTTGKYNLTLDANGGTLQGYGNASTATKQVTYGETYGALPVPSRDGYEFVGWSGKNLFTGFTKGIRLSSINGMENIDSNSATSDYIALSFENNRSYVISGLTNRLNSFAAAYNENKQFMGRTPGTHKRVLNLNNLCFYIQSTSVGGKITYVRITQYKTVENEGSANDIDNLQTQLELGDDVTEYEPYQVITSQTEVTKASNHTLTAIWEPV